MHCGPYNFGLILKKTLLFTLGKKRQQSMLCEENPLTISGSFQCPLPAAGINSSCMSPYQLKMSTTLWNESFEGKIVKQI